MKLNLIRTGCCLLMLCIVQAACIHDDNGDCPPEKERQVLVIRSFDGAGNELTGTGTVSEVMLYVFDAQNHFLQSIPCKENETVPLDYPGQGKITVVGWGNSQSDKQNMPRTVAGASLESLQMNLLRSPDGYLLSPDDLFYGSVSIGYPAVTRVAVTAHQLSLQRKVASMEIVVKGISRRFDTADTDFALQVNETAEGIGFSGELSAVHNSYRPVCGFNSLKELVAPVFHTLPSGGNPVMITLYKGSEPVYEVSTDDGGASFMLEAGKLLSVVIDLDKGSGGSAYFDVKKWNESNINQEF